MNAGGLNRLITLQKRSVSQGTNGYIAETWATAFTAWSQIITTGGREFYAAQKLNAETSAIFKIRFTRAVNVQMRIKYGNRTFEIIGINDVDGRHEELQISAKEAV